MEKKITTIKIKQPFGLIHIRQIERKFAVQEMISEIPRFSTKIYKLFERVSFMHLQHQFFIKFEVNLTKSSIQNLFGFTFLMNKNVASMVKTLDSQKCIVLKY